MHDSPRVNPCAFPMRTHLMGAYLACCAATGDVFTCWAILRNGRFFGFPWEGGGTAPACDRWLGLKWVCRRNRVFTTRATSMTPAASALSPTSRARKSHEIIGQGLQLLINLDHRGAVGADPLVGDGAGILIQIPDRAACATGRKRPASPCRQPGQYAVAMCFLPREAKAREIVVKQFEHFIKVEGQMLLGWRDVPTDPDRPGQDRARTACR